MRNRLEESGVLEAIPPEDYQPPPELSKSTAESISGWLDIAIKLCRLSPSESAALRDELESHLNERVNDLLVIGQSEQEGIRRAISELGDAALFAQRYRTQRNEPNRRRIMNGILIGGVGAALALSVTAVTVSQPDRSSNYYPSGTAYSVQDGFSDKMIDISFAEAPFGEVVAYLTKATGERSFTHWLALEDSGLSPEDAVSLDVGRVPLSTAMVLLNEALDLSDVQQLEYRDTDGFVEFATRDYFDQRERFIATFDTDTFLRHDVGVEEAVDVLTKMVEPDAWTRNGGETARVHVVGALVFIDGPPRIHDGAAWIFGQLSYEEEEPEEGAMNDGWSDPGEAAETRVQIESDGGRVRLLVMGPDGESIIEADRITLSGQITSVSRSNVSDGPGSVPLLGGIPVIGDMFTEQDPGAAEDPSGVPSDPGARIDDPAATSRQYTVKSGDSLHGIAQRELGASGLVGEITNLNPGLTQQRLRAGQQINLPQ